MKSSCPQGAGCFDGVSLLWKVLSGPRQQVGANPFPSGEILGSRGNGSLRSLMGSCGACVRWSAGRRTGVIWTSSSAASGPGGVRRRPWRTALRWTIRWARILAAWSVEGFEEGFRKWGGGCGGAEQGRGRGWRDASVRLGPQTLPLSVPGSARKILKNHQKINILLGINAKASAKSLRKTFSLPPQKPAILLDPLS